MGRDAAIPHAEELDELEARFPGWQVWTSGPTWCARPWPLINCGSAEELAERIRIAHSVPPDGSPSLASWRSYRARLRALHAFEDAAGGAWRKMRAEADRWPHFPKTHRESRSAREAGTGVTVTPGTDAAGLPDIIA